MNRREFISAASAAALLRIAARPLRLEAQEAVTISVEAEELTFSAMPKNFTGLSYEMPQLYNPQFFSASNHGLVTACRALSMNGVLRLGGNLSDLSRWKSDGRDFSTEKQRAAIEHGKTYWEWKLTDPTVRANRDGAITPEAIRNLKTFLDATNWKLIYGLNFGSGTAERASDEAACVAREMGSRLIAFQVGNESDFFGGNRFFRERGFDINGYMTGYQEFVTEIRKRTPAAPFAGPDTANNMSWVDEFGTRSEKPIMLLSSHYYAMGPAKNPEMNAERLLAPNPSLQRQIDRVRQAVKDAGGTPFRMTEGNSCFGGGKLDVSDAFASALWVADYMLQVASAGYAGVNIHGGGDGIYTPIETMDSTPASLRPLYYGMQFANRFAGWDLAQCVLRGSASANAYLGHSKGRTQLALINKGSQALQVHLGSGIPAPHKTDVWHLSGSSLEAKQGVSLTKAKRASKEPFVLSPYSASLLVWQ